MLIDRWEIISSIEPHGFRSPEEAYAEMGHGIWARIRGLVYYHPTNDFGIFGISDGSIFEFDFMEMSDANTVRNIKCDDAEIGEPSELYERTFPNAKFRLFNQFNIFNPCEGDGPEMVEPDPPTEDELEQEQRDNFESGDDSEDDEEMDDWDWYGYQNREDDNESG